MQRPDLDLRTPKDASMADRKHNVEQDANMSTTARTNQTLRRSSFVSGVTTQPVETVIALLGASRDGASINCSRRSADGSRHGCDGTIHPSASKLSLT